MSGYDELKRYFSPYLGGPNINAVLYALGATTDILQNTSIAVTDQLTISTASGKYLEMVLSNHGFTKPSELAVSDYVFGNVGIATTATKLIPDVIQRVLELFYGLPAVRANTTSTLTGPYNLSVDNELVLVFEDGEPHTIMFQPQNFLNIQQATVQEVVNNINAALIQQKINAFAEAHTDFTTGLQYVQLFGAARGPYSFVKVLGGSAQLQFQFPLIRDTILPGGNTTVWQITKHDGNIVRFRWDSGPEPMLSSVLIGDTVLIYGAPFVNVDPALQGTFTVTNMIPAGSIPSFTSGWFEIMANVPNLLNSIPNVPPPSNTIGATYSYLVNQTTDDDLKFYLAVSNTPYSQSRYALAFEPAPALLKVFLPATTTAITTNLIGAAHLHDFYPADDLNGTYGSATDPSQMIDIINDYTISWPQDRMDNLGTGGTLTYDSTARTIDRIYRECERVYAITTTPHGIIGTDQWLSSLDYTPGEQAVYNGRLWTALLNSGPSFGGSHYPMTPSLYWNDSGASLNLTTTSVTVEVETVDADDSAHPWLGPYVWDPEADYTLAAAEGTTRESIIQGSGMPVLHVDGTFPNQSGYLLLDLNLPTQEGPIGYNMSQLQATNIAVPIQSISRTGIVVTVITAIPHGAVPGSQVQIAGTTNFNGTQIVTNVVSDTVYDFATAAVGDVVEYTGVSTTLIPNPSSLLTLDPSYRFQYSHAISATVALLSAKTAYVPKIDGTDYSFYVTGTADARIWCQDIIEAITAAGINLEIVIVYPDSTGLGNHGDSENLDGSGPYDEAASYVWSSSDIGALPG